MAQILLLLATAFPWATHGLRLGEPTWHHNLSLLFVLGLTALWWRPLTTNRAFIGIGVLATTVLALLSGFLILYLKADLKAWEIKDWAKFWHVLWSWAALIWAVSHTALNWQPFKRMLARWHQGPIGFLTFALPWALILLAIPLTWSTWGARMLQQPQYLILTLWTWLILLVPAYGMWIVAKVGMARRPPARRHPYRWARRVSVQSFVDVWLVPLTILANVSGFPLLYFATKETSLKYVAKYWHTWPSVAMAIVVFVHSIQFWPGVRNHWKQMKT
jgi:hypothetical protein